MKDGEFRIQNDSSAVMVSLGARRALRGEGWKTAASASAGRVWLVSRVSTAGRLEAPSALNRADPQRRLAFFPLSITSPRPVALAGHPDLATTDRPTDLTLFRPPWYSLSLDARVASHSRAAAVNWRGVCAGERTRHSTRRYSGHRSASADDHERMM